MMEDHAIAPSALRIYQDHPRLPVPATDLFVGLPKSKYQFVRDAFNLYLTKSWQGPLDLRHKRLRLEAIQEHPWLPIHEAATRLCLDPSLVSRLIETKQVPSRIYQYPSGRTDRVVDLAALEKITPALRHVSTVEGAAQMLGLTKQRVVQLIRAGLLTVWGGKPKQGMRWHIDQAPIQAILKRASACSIDWCRCRWPGNVKESAAFSR